MQKEVLISESFSNETRLRILMLLCGGSLSVNRIAKSLKLPQPIISRHLSIMRRNELLDCLNKGNYSYYSFDFKGKFASLKEKLALTFHNDSKFAKVAGRIENKQ